VGNCVAFAPSVFALDTESKAVVSDVSSVDEFTLLEAAKSCPEQAIIIEDDQGQQLYP
jgi:ferredoxin